MSPSLNLYKNVVLDQGETVSLSNLSTEQCPGAPLTFFNDGGVRRIFLGLTFGQKGFFWVYERRRDFFGSRKQHRDFFGYCIFNNNVNAIYCLCGITGYF